MTRALEAVQGERSRASWLAPVTLVVLRLYSDRAGEVEGEAFYFAGRAATYDYGDTGTARDFEPLLREVGDLVASMNHLPDPVETFDKPLQIMLSNEVRDGTRLSERLRQTYRLENARVEVAQVLLPPAQARGDSAVRLDLSGLQGDEHTVLYRGRVAAATITQSSIVLDCRFEVPTIGWQVSDDPDVVSPDALGVRAPIVYGAAKRVPLTAFETGPRTALVDDLAAGATTATGADFSRFSAAGSALVGSEEISWTGKTATTLTGLTRGSNGTIDQEHKVGARIVEIAAERHMAGIVAGAVSGVSAISKVYAEHPLRKRELVQLVSGRHYSAVFDDTTLRTGYAATYIEMNVAQVRTFFRDLSVGSLFPTDAPTPLVDQQIDADVAQNSIGVTNPERLNDGSDGVGDPYAQFGGNASAWLSWSDPAGALNVSSRRLRIVQATSSSADEYFFIWSHPFGDPDRVLVGTVPHEPGGGVATFTIPEAYQSQLGYDVASHLSVRVTEVSMLIDYDQPATVDQAFASETFPLALYADVDGPLVPNPSASFAQVHDFDAGSWTGAVIDSVDFDEGTGSVQMEVEVDLATEDAMTESDAAAEWDPDDWSVADDATVHLDGSSIKFTRSDSTALMRSPVVGTYSPLKDVSAAGLAFRFKVRWSGAALSTPQFNFRASFNGLVSGTETLIWIIDASAIPVDTWWDVVLPIAEPDTGSVGDTDFSELRFVQISVTNFPNVGGSFWIDQLEIVSADAQPASEAYRTLASPEDWESEASLYRFDLRTDGGGEAVLWFSSDTTASPKPSDRLEVAVNLAGLAGGGFTELLRVATVVGSPDPSAIRSLGITYSPTAAGVSRREAAFVSGGIPMHVWFDDLEKASDVAGFGYLADIDDLIEHPADVFRHFVEVVLGQAVDETSVLAAQTNLGASAKLAADLRVLGNTTAEVLATLGYHSRANVVPAEDQAGTRWRFLTAESDHGFPATAGLIADWGTSEGIAEETRDIADLGTRFAAHYAPDPSLGRGDALYTAIAVATPDASDVATTAAALEAFEEQVGRLDAAPYGFPALRDEGTLLDVFGYYVAERARFGALVVVREAPWWDAYALECGDILSVQLPWKSSSTKLRVLEYTKRFTDEQATVRLIEVV